MQNPAQPFFFLFSFFVPRLDCSPCGLINSAPILLNFPQRTICFLGWRGIFALHWMDGGEDAFVCGSVSQIIWDRRFFFLVAVRFGISPRDGGMQGTSLFFFNNPSNVSLSQGQGLQKHVSWGGCYMIYLLYSSRNLRTSSSSSLHPNIQEIFRRSFTPADPLIQPRH